MLYIGHHSLFDHVTAFAISHLLSKRLQICMVDILNLFNVLTVLLKILMFRFLLLTITGRRQHLRTDVPHYKTAL